MNRDRSLLTVKNPGRKVCVGFGVSLLSLLAACATMVPALTNLAVAFAQDLLASASVNYTPRYAIQVEELLVALAAQGSKLPLQPQLADSGYRPPPPDYVQHSQPQPGYGGDSDPYAQNQQGGFQDPYDQVQQGGFQDTYAGNQPETYPVPDARTPPLADYPAAPEPYAQSTARTRSARPPINMNALLLAQKAGSHELVTVEDGQVLRDGRGDPARGDRLKVQFQTNCACYVYVLGIDATGYVANIFPDPDDPGLGNPVEPGTQYVLPRGEDWWGLDDYRGVEQVYFVASRVPRPDIEGAMRNLGDLPRQLSPDAYRPVNEPAVVPTRGMVKVSAPRQVSVQAGSSVDNVMATTFEAVEGEDLVITRWFRHE